MLKYHWMSTLQNSQTSNGKTALMAASGRGYLDSVNALLAAKAYVDAKDTMVGCVDVWDVWTVGCVNIYV